MGKMVSGIVLAVALLAPISIARAAEVQQLYTNNMFASASWSDGAGTFTSVLVTRLKGKDAGKMIIHFTSNDEFERIVSFLRKAS